MQPDPEIVERYRRWVAPKTVPQPAKQAPTEPVVQPLYRRMVMTEMNADERLDVTQAFDKVVATLRPHAAKFHAGEILSVVENEAVRKFPDQGFAFTMVGGDGTIVRGPNVEYTHRTSAVTRNMQASTNTGQSTSTSKPSDEPTTQLTPTARRMQSFTLTNKLSPTARRMGNPLPASTLTRNPESSAEKKRRRSANSTTVATSPNKRSKKGGGQ